MRVVRERDGRDVWSAHDGRDERERMERGDVRDGRAGGDGPEARRFEAPRPRDMRVREWDARDLREPWQGAAGWGRPDLHARRESLDRRVPMDQEREMRERLGRDAGDHSWGQQSSMSAGARCTDNRHRHSDRYGDCRDAERYQDRDRSPGRSRVEAQARGRSRSPDRNGHGDTARGWRGGQHDADRHRDRDRPRVQERGRSRSPARNGHSDRFEGRRDAERYRERDRSRSRDRSRDQRSGPRSHGNLAPQMIHP